MSSEATTTRGRYIFRVKEYADGTRWIMMELLKGPALEIFRDGFLGFDLEPGTTLQQAQQIASRMNDSITDTAYTRLK